MTERIGCSTLGLILAVFGTLCTAVSCASTKETAAASPAATSPSTVTETRIKTGRPAPKKRGYFYPIDAAVIADVETGTPASLRRAVKALRSNLQDENRKVLYAVATEMLRMVWAETVSWDVPAVEQSTAYTGALTSARQGIYDESTGNSDFLATLLPSLVIPDSASVASFFAPAEKALRSCLSENASSVAAAYLLGLLYQKNANHEKAVEYFRTAEKYDGENKSVLYAKAVSLSQLGAHTDAEGIAAELFSRSPSDISVLKLNAQLAFAEKDWTRAEDYAARILQQTPNDAEYILFRAKVLMERGEYVRAASMLDAYSRQDTFSRDYLVLRARLQNNWSRAPAAAIATIETALSRYPADEAVLLLAAELAAESGGSVGGKTAEELAAAVLSRNPNNTAAMEYAVRGMMQAKNWKEAFTACRTLIQRVPDNRTYRLLYAAICLEIGRNDDAWNTVTALYRDAAEDAAVLETYITVLVRTGKSGQALELINENLGTADTDFRSFLYYQRSFLRSRQDDVLSDLRSSLISNPRNTPALFRLYEIYYAQREYRRAQYYLKQVVALNPNDALYRRLNDELTKLIDN